MFKVNDEMLSNLFATDLGMATKKLGHKVIGTHGVHWLVNRLLRSLGR